MTLRRLFTLAIVLTSTVGFAQGPPPPPPPGLPIDGGIFILALIGMYFGIKKIKR